jgi:hypothetical protein
MWNNTATSTGEEVLAAARQGGSLVQRSLVLAVSLCLVVVASVAAFSGRTDDPLGVAVSPHTLILGADQGGAVAVHTAIPLSAVDTSTLDLNGIPVVWTKADARGELVAMFSEDAVKAIVAPPSAVLTLTGQMANGTGFSGSDEARVVIEQ